MNKTEKVRFAFNSNPNANVHEVASKYDVALSQVYKIRAQVRRSQSNVPFVMSQPVNNTVAVIRSVKALAKELGGLRQLANLCEAMS